MKKEEVTLSIFEKKKNLKKVLSVLKNSNKKEFVLSIGCGDSSLLPFLVKQFNRVHVLTKSDACLKGAVKKASHFKNIKFTHSKLSKFITNKKFEVIISDDLFEKDYEETLLNLSKIYLLLKKKGKFIGIFPSMESYAYLSHLYLFSFTGMNNDINKTFRSINKSLFTKNSFDNFGFHKVNGKTSKLFYHSELKLLFGILGFKNIKISKVSYSWESLLGKTGVLPFKNHEEFWSWFVVAEK